MTVPNLERIEWASLGGGVALVLGSFMTWATAGPFKVSGLDGDGWFTLALGVAAVAMVLKRRFRGAAIAAVLALALVVWKFADLASLADESDFFEVSPGAGLFVCGLGAAVTASTGVIRWMQLRSND